MCVNRYLWNEIKFIPWISCFWSHTRCVWGEHQSHCRTITANQPHFTRQNDTAITAWILGRWGLLQISSQTTECPHCYSSIPELQVLHVYIYKTFLQIHLPSYIHVWWSILDLFPLLTLHLVSTVNCMPEYFLHTNNRLSTTQIIFFPNSSFIFFLLFIAYTMYQKHLPTCELKFSTTPTVDKMNFSADEPPSLLHALLSNETDRSLFSGLKLTTCGPLKLIWVLLVGASVCEQYTYIYICVCNMKINWWYNTREEQRNLRNWRGLTLVSWGQSDFLSGFWFIILCYKAYWRRMKTAILVHWGGGRHLFYPHYLHLEIQCLY